MESPDRLKKILDALIDYHTQLVQEHTLQSQSPTDVVNLKAILREKSRDIKLFLQGGRVPVANSDTEFRKFLDVVGKLLEPWDHEISALSKYWTQMMFEEFPLSISPEHTKRLLESAKYIEPVDGQHTSPRMS